MKRRSHPIARRKHSRNPKLEIEIISSNDMLSDKHSLLTCEDDVVGLMASQEEEEERRNVKRISDFCQRISDGKSIFGKIPSKNIIREKTKKGIDVG